MDKFDYIETSADGCLNAIIEMMDQQLDRQSIIRFIQYNKSFLVYENTCELCACIAIIEGYLVGLNDLEEGKLLFQNALSFFCGMNIVYFAYAKFQFLIGDLLKSRQILSSMLETQPLNQQVSTILKNVQNGKNSFGFENKRAFSKISYYWDNFSPSNPFQSVFNDKEQINESKFATPCKSLKREKILERCIKTPTLPPIVMMLSRGIYDDEDSSDHYKSFCKLNFSNIDVKEEVSVCKSPEAKIKRVPKTPRALVGPRRVAVNLESCENIEKNTSNKKANEIMKQTKESTSSNGSSATFDEVSTEPDKVQEFKKNLKVLLINNEAYWLAKLIGRGGSSFVYQVGDSSGNIKAVKEVSFKSKNEPSYKSFISEISILKNLRNPTHVVEIFDYEIGDGFLYMVMEFGSTDLCKLMNKKKLIPLEVAAYWNGILNAILYIHSNDVIHLDIKPENFILVEGTIKLIDFGISTSLHPGASCIYREILVGTLNYISPETLQNQSNSEQPLYKVIIINYFKN